MVPIMHSSQALFSRAASGFLVLFLVTACDSTTETPDGGDAASSADGGDAAMLDGARADAPGADAPGVDAPRRDAPGSVTDPVDLGSAADFVILAKSGISTVPTSAITGDLGISPAAATFITGFSLTADATNVFSTAPQVTGRVYASDYAAPTPSNMTTAIGDMELAFTNAAGRAPDVTELGAGSIGGMTLEPGVYAWGTGLLIPTNITLEGNATDVWIFQISGDLTMSSGARVTLAGGASASNIFWQVAGGVEMGTTSHCEGTILSMTAVSLRTGATVNGRILAQTAVDIDGSTLVAP